MGHAKTVTRQMLFICTESEAVCELFAGGGDFRQGIAKQEHEEDREYGRSLFTHCLNILNSLEVEVVWTMECNADKCNATNSQCKFCNILTLYSVFQDIFFARELK